MKVNVLEAKNKLSHLLHAAQAGEEVIIANRGRPVARLVPIVPGEGQAEAAEHGLVTWLNEHPLPEHARRSAAQIDQAITTERDGWD